MTKIRSQNKRFESNIHNILLSFLYILFGFVVTFLAAVSMNKVYHTRGWFCTHKSNGTLNLDVTQIKDGKPSFGIPFTP